jgi:hypothetical protein
MKTTKDWRGLLRSDCNASDSVLISSNVLIDLLDDVEAPHDRLAAMERVENEMRGRAGFDDFISGIDTETRTELLGAIVDAALGDT